MEQVEKQRADRFSSLKTVQDTLRFPSEFDQTEALYVLVGRSNSNELQKLIQQANQISDGSDRVAALSILFLRLVDIDPNAAVALSGQGAFIANEAIAASIWRGWSRKNLPQALSAARLLTPQNRKFVAAQAIYRAYGVSNKQAIIQIEQSLAIAPSRWTQSQNAEALATESPIGAIEFLNQLRPAGDQNYVASRLGGFLGQTRAADALGFAAAITSSTARQRYRHAALKAVASSDPDGILNRWLTEPNARRSDDPVSTAFEQLAQTDLESAIGFWRQIDEKRHKDRALKVSLIGILAAQIGRSSHSEALEWAQGVEDQGLRGGLSKAVGALSALDPEQTLIALSGLPENALKNNLLASVIAKVAQSDPKLALGEASKLPESSSARKSAISGVVRQWLKYDESAALDYLFENQSEFDLHDVSELAYSVSISDPHKLMSYLPDVNEDVAQVWMARITGSLLERSSGLSVEQFFQKYRDNPRASALQASLVAQLAYRDPERAHAFAQQIPAGKERDRAYMNILSSTLENDPESAAAILSTITDPQIQRDATSQLAYRWLAKDSQAARKWVETLPLGASRDHAIQSIALSHLGGADEDVELIQKISDDFLRRQSMQALIIQVASKDAERANQINKNSELSEDHKRLLATAIERCQSAAASSGQQNFNCGSLGYH
jgi:hypothetical protein